MRPLSLVGIYLTGLWNGIGAMISAGISLGGDTGRMANLGLEVILGKGRFGLSVAMKDDLSGVTIYQEHQF